MSNTNKRYFYDDNTGHIFPLDELNFNNDIFRNKYFKLLNSKKTVSSNKFRSVKPEDVRDYLINRANGFKQLILEVTTKCNFRCKYCCYSDFYKDNRTHGLTNMSWETAKKAIDYYASNFYFVSKRNPLLPATIGFYGGEPLINFKLIKKVVEYLESTYKYDFNYNITVNGSLFTKEIQDFLVAHNFAILVSLDGDKQTHDRNRVKIDGTGTFDEIIKNLRTFRENHPHYHKFGISGCYDLKTNFSDVEKFFDEEKLFVMNYTQVEPNNTTYYSQFSDSDMINFQNSYHDFENKFADFAEKYKNTNDIRTFLYSMIGRKYLDFSYHSVMNEQRSSLSPFTGTCIPGEKLYVSVDGNIHICEKINHNTPIRDVNYGLNYNRIAEILNMYNSNVCSQCNSCNVKKFCSVCLAKTSCNSGFGKAKDYCKNFESSIKNMLIKFVSLLEKNPKLFEKITVDYYTNVLDIVGEQF